MDHDKCLAYELGRHTGMGLCKKNGTCQGRLKLELDLKNVENGQMAATMKWAKHFAAICVTKGCDCERELQELAEQFPDKEIPGFEFEEDV